MSLLREIQAALMDQGHEIGSIFLKLRFLSARLGSDPLEEWVKYESEGYPNDVPVPEYRKLSVSYTGTFSGHFGRVIANATIPPYLVEKHAGEQWNTSEIRQSIAAIDDLISTASADGGSGYLGINAANLILLLQGNVYADFACNSITGKVSKAALVETRHAVRARILELTLELEKRIPAAAEIKLVPVAAQTKAVDSRTVTRITNQVIYGNSTTITSSGDGAQIRAQVAERDSDSFRKALAEAGLPDEDVKELAEIVETEEPESAERPWGARAKVWLTQNLGKAADGTCKVGREVATRLLTEAAMQYYGLK